MEHDVGSLAGGLFPAVSWMSCRGELSFNFGERPWRCEAATPGGDRFRPISEAGSGNTPVMEAASEGHLEVCSLLLDSAAVEDVGRRHQRTLLHWAAWWGDVELARRVLEASGDRDACMRAIDADGLNAVWHAADRGHAEVLRVLWRASASVTGVLSADMTSRTAGADFNHVALEGRTPAHLAAEGGFTEALRVLKEAGANLSHADNDGKTPAHRAAAGGHPGVMRVLIEASADLSSVVNENGASLAHQAAAGGFVEVLRELVTQVHVVLGAEHDTVTLVMQIFEKPAADLSHADNDGRTPGHGGAACGRRGNGRAAADGRRRGRAGHDGTACGGRES
eukprot:gene34676-biopygen35444